MSVSDLLRFTFSALLGHRLRAGLCLLGVAIGVTCVILLTALGEGARRYVVGQFSNMGTNILLVTPGRTETTGGMPAMGGVPKDLTLADAEAIRREVPSVIRLAPVSMGTESVSSGDRSRQIPVVGSTYDLLVARDLEMALGRFLPDQESSRGSTVAVLGHKTARELFPGENPIGKVIRIGDWRMRVTGVLAPKGMQLGMDLDDLVIIPVSTGLRMFNRPSLFQIVIKVSAHTNLEAARLRIEQLLEDRHGEKDITCISQEAMVTTFSSILHVLTLALAGIAAISLTVAGTGIMNVMLVAVSERTHEVGLLKALGVTRSQVLAVFMAEATVISTIGGLVGLAGGWAAVRLLVFIYPKMPASPPEWAVILAVSLSVGVGIIFGVLPARRATRMDPVAALARR